MPPAILLPDFLTNSLPNLLSLGCFFYGLGRRSQLGRFLIEPLQNGIGGFLILERVVQVSLLFGKIAPLLARRFQGRTGFIDRSPGFGQFLRLHGDIVLDRDDGVGRLHAAAALAVAAERGDKKHQEHHEQEHGQRRDIGFALAVDIAPGQGAGFEDQQRDGAPALGIEVEHPVQHLFKQMEQGTVDVRLLPAHAAERAGQRRPAIGAVAVAAVGITGVASLQGCRRQRCRRQGADRFQFITHDCLTI